MNFIKLFSVVVIAFSLSAAPIAKAEQAAEPVKTEKVDVAKDSVVQSDKKECTSCKEGKHCEDCKSGKECKDCKKNKKCDHCKDSKKKMHKKKCTHCDKDKKESHEGHGAESHEAPAKENK